MSIESMAGSVGKELLKSATNKNGAVRKFGESLGKKLLEKFSDKLASNKSFQEQLQKLIKNHHDAESSASPRASRGERGSWTPPARAGGGLDSAPGLQLGRISTEKAVSTFQSFDLDHDGEITQSELAEGIKEIDKQLAQLPGGDSAGGNSEDSDANADSQTNLAQLNKMRNVAQNALNHYQTIAGLDGNSGFSIDDISQLAGQDGHDKSISRRDWKSIMA